MMITKECPFCGQGQVIQIRDNATEQEIRNEAVRKCCCDGAERHKELANVRRNVELLFGDASAEKFGSGFSMGVQDHLCNWASKVYDGLYEKMVVTMENGDKATIVRSGTRIKVSREQKIKGEK